MANIEKIVCNWSGSWVGAPGYSTFYASAAQAAPLTTKLVTFWQTVASYIPTGITVNVPTTGVVLNEFDGKAVSNWSGGTVGAIPGTGTSSYSSVSGAVIRWETGQYRRGKPVRGRTFIVPIYSSAYSTGGVIAPAVVAALKGAADALRSASGQLVVYHRPKFDDSTPPIMLFSGEGISCTSTFVGNKVVYLSTRRD